MLVKYVTSDRKHEGFVKVSNSMKFSELQKRIAQKVKIPKDRKVLLYLEDILVKDDLTFEDYEMKSGDIVTVLILPANCTVKHRGSIEGISVGTRWSKRKDVAEAGVHTPLQSGISGDRLQGANSIVLSGGYEDDIDCGDILYYTGCGGRTSGVQTSDQPWNNFNESLAINCGASIDRTKGVLATDWNKCFSVRVVKNTSGGRNNRNNSEEPYVFIGYYKVCGCWPVRGRSGFRVWRFLLIKDNGESNKVLNLS